MKEKEIMQNWRNFLLKEEKEETYPEQDFKEFDKQDPEYIEDVKHCALQLAFARRNAGWKLGKDEAEVDLSEVEGCRISTNYVSFALDVEKEAEKFRGRSLPKYLPNQVQNRTEHSSIAIENIKAQFVSGIFQDDLIEMVKKYDPHGLEMSSLENVEHVPHSGLTLAVQYRRLDKEIIEMDYAKIYKEVEYYFLEKGLEYIQQSKVSEELESIVNADLVKEPFVFKFELIRDFLDIPFLILGSSILYHELVHAQKAQNTVHQRAISWWKGLTGNQARKVIKSFDMEDTEVTPLLEYWLWHKKDIARFDDYQVYESFFEMYYEYHRKEEIKSSLEYEVQAYILQNDFIDALQSNFQIEVGSIPPGPGFQKLRIMLKNRISWYIKYSCRIATRAAAKKVRQKVNKIRSRNEPKSDLSLPKIKLSKVSWGNLNLAKPGSKETQHIGSLPRYSK